MSRIYKGWIINPINGGSWKAENGKKQSIQAKDIEWILREIDEREEGVHRDEN